MAIGLHYSDLEAEGVPKRDVFRQFEHIEDDGVATKDKMNLSAELQAEGASTASFAMGFVSSEAFRALFREGMMLVEDAAAYLDGEGRNQSKTLDRMAALGYASESMRLTTRLMQIASWLLLQRAVVEGELSPTQAAKEKHKVNIAIESQPAASEAFLRLPAELRELVSRSLRLQARIVHLDQVLSAPRAEARLPPVKPSPVAAQQALLRSVFDRR